MCLIDRIKTYAKHGGAWEYLEKELVKAGMSPEFAQYFSSSFRKNLGEDNANKAVAAYELWAKTNDESPARVYIRLHGL